MMPKRSRLSRKKLTLSDARRLNVEKGRYFFSPDTMKFFNSCVESDLIANKYFVTSEKRSGDPFLDIPAGERMFSIREFNSKTGNISTVGEFQEFGTRAQALKKVKKLAGDE